MHLVLDAYLEGLSIKGIAVALGADGGAGSEGMVSAGLSIFRWRRRLFHVAGDAGILHRGMGRTLQYTDEVSVFTHQYVSLGGSVRRGVTGRRRIDVVESVSGVMAGHAERAITDFLGLETSRQNTGAQGKIEPLTRKLETGRAAGVEVQNAWTQPIQPSASQFPLFSGGQSGFSNLYLTGTFAIEALPFQHGMVITVGASDS